MNIEKAKEQADNFKKSMINNGFEEYIFIAKLDEKTCSICAKLDGKVFNIKDMKTGVNMYPMHDNCRCSAATYFDREKWEQSMRDRGLYSDEEKCEMKASSTKETKLVKSNKGFFARLFNK